MPFLVDANVLSEVTKPRPAPGVARWLEENEEELVVDPIILGELQAGILYMPRGRRRQSLQEWFDEVAEAIFCISWEAKTGLRWAALLADLRSSGRRMPLKDSFIAASALTHGLIVATRNESDFRLAGVEVVNPFNL